MCYKGPCVEDGKSAVPSARQRALPGMQADAANRVDVALRTALDKYRDAKG